MDQQQQPAPVPPEPTSEPLQPGTHLRLAVLAYVAINLLYGLPGAIWPDLIWGTIGGVDSPELEVLAAMRWGGAILVAWAIGGFLVLGRPKGRQTMVTTFALQYTLAAVALATSLFAGEFDFADTWFSVASVLVVAAGAAYLWYARWTGREVLTA